ncbi:xanthine dehydrogenase family protein molybdopterin-binding subunit [Photobacterium phosphoreum]|uniref:Xanthine dehydrogenase family protein molybdopterin-binding subunit n=2 Tax=Photobacterium phosphoreum TaxID=659 RepID=A0A2T3JWS2_PHOPO|nr:xanthine dehydrogenase family protein molybdopterin-binding subunit [Photobacterium phosphoreum]PSU43526.1 xanthine dehydrogenase family protein molybdopterin-binding subunit [Photobacterium phosphoreum]PSU53741.1 xanthine dehydrogenase family protein molybdopterin-binding subunit [Photobacterium phosphoreum]
MMSMELSRRSFIKHGIIAGICVYTVPALARFNLNLDGSNSLVAPELASSWKSNFKVRFRSDAIAKVTGEKVYGRDLRSTDIDGWPSEQSWAFYIRADRADRIYQGVDLSLLPANAQPSNIVTAATLIKDKIELPQFYGTNMLVAEGAMPDYIGQAVMLLIFDDFLTYHRAKNTLQFNREIIKYGKQQPLVAAEKDPWGVWRITREQGNAEGVLPDKYSPLKNGVNFPNYVDHKPFWPQSNPLGSALEQQMAVANDIKASLHDDNNFVLDRTYQTQFIDPMFLEPECFNGWFDPKTQTMHTIPSSQSPSNFFGFATMMLNNGPLAGKVKNLVVHSPFIGGGFGGKDHSILPFYGLLAVMYSKHPVRMANDRFQQFQSGLKRHPFNMHNQLAIDKTTGKFQGIVSDMILDGGGRENFSSVVAEVGASALQSIYYFPKNDITAVANVSENPASGSMRGFGTLQTMASMEMMVNEAAQLLNIDPIDLRLRNAIKTGQLNTQGAVPTSTEHYAEILKQAQQHEMWTQREQRRKAYEAKHPNKRFGTGFAICTKDYGAGDDAPSTYIEMDKSGRLVMGISAVEIGTGAQTSQAAVLADYFGRPADTINLAEVHGWDPLQMINTQSPFTMSQAYQDKMQQNPRWTPTIPYASSASTSAYFQSKATENAAKVIFEYGLWPAAKAIWSKLYYSGDLAAMDFGAMEDAVWVEGKLSAKGMEPLPLDMLAQHVHQKGLVTAAMVHTFNRWGWVDAEFTVEGQTQTYQLDAMAVKYGHGADANKKKLMTSSGWHLLDRNNVNYPATVLNNAMVVYYAPCAVLVELAVEEGSGKVEIVATQTWLDAGKVIVKELVEGQIEGGLVMGIGHVLHEYLPPGEDGPGNGTWNLNRYKVPLATDVGVWQMNHTILPPFNNSDQRKGIAEVVMIPIVAAVTEALYQITHKRFYHLPVTATDIKEALA